MMIFGLSSCNQDLETGQRSSVSNPYNLFYGGGSSDTTNASTGAPTDGGLGGGTTTDTKPKVEIRHFVSPQTGSFVQKLTIPKNFSGMLYLSGLNMTSLADRHISVNFYFGHTREKVTVSGVVARAPGITPTTDIEVLILNMSSKPFENLRMLYELYDYNQYDFDQKDPDDGTFAVSEPTDGPKTSNLDEGLFCRALILDDDPTYRGSTGSCSSLDEMCLYAYAKVKDRGLQEMNEDFDAGLTLYPTLPQIDHEGIGYYSDASESLVDRCLPDNPRFDDSGEYDPSAAYLFVSESVFFDALGALITGSDDVDYTYLGPYKTTNKSLWQISSFATIGKYGLFLDTLDNSGDVAYEEFGINSLLFPRYIKRNLSANVEHLSNARPNGFKTILPFPSNGTSEWMDGCNERVTSLNAETNEHIGSCTASAIIEIVAKDPATGVEEIVAGRGDGGVEIKLQLVKASAINNEGLDVLYSNLNSCENSSSCGSNECCYNSKCWSKDLVSSCLEDNAATGNGPIGATCTTDYQCSSLCCNKSIGLCTVHDTTQDPQVLCSKPAGQQCISKEFCAQSVIQECFIVKTGVNNTGATTCALRCYNRLKHGDCKSGQCTPPLTPSVPIFNPADPNRCDAAIDPPSE
jgi:hypothetical protein